MVKEAHVKRREIGYIALVAMLWVLIPAVATSAGCSCDNSDCFEDLTITEAGIDIVRGTYRFTRMHDGKASFENEAGVRIYHNGSEWIISGSGGTWYIHDSEQTVTPPASNWQTGPDGDIPLPRVSQPDECGGPPEITYVRFSTNPWSGQWVTEAKTVTLRIVSSKLLGDVRATIMDQPATLVSTWHRSDGHQYDFRYAPGATDPEGPVTFTLEYEDIAGRAGPRITEADEIVETSLHLPYCERSCPDGVYVYDRTPPTIPTRVYPEEGAIIRDGTVSLRWMESTDDLSGVNAYIITVRSSDGGFEDEFARDPGYGPEATLYYLEEGTYTWSISAVDYARNMSSSTTGTFTLDIPDGELVISKPLGYVALEEGGGYLEIITVGLSESPASDVRVVLEWDQQLSTEASEIVTSLDLTFTPTSWDAVPVCLYAVDDNAYEGFHAATIWGLTVSDDYDFDALDTTTTIYITDNDPLFQGVNVVAASESGEVLDIGIPEWMVPEGQDPPTMEGYVLSAAIEIGTPITGGVSIETAFGTPLISTQPTATLQQLLIEEIGHTLVEVTSQSLYYDLLRDGFYFSFETTNLEESLYLLTIEYEDGSTEDFLIELMAPAP